jgi:hypothetical protein
MQLLVEHVLMEMQTVNVDQHVKYEVKKERKINETNKEMTK